MTAHPPYSAFRLRRHGDFQRVYKTGRKQYGRQMSYFYRLRTEEDAPMPETPRIGLTVGKVISKKAVERNRIKRRMREAVRHNLGLLHAPVDVVLHPKRDVIDLEFAQLEREVAQVFQRIQQAIEHPAGESQSRSSQAKGHP